MLRRAFALSLLLLLSACSSHRTYTLHPQQVLLAETATEDGEELTYRLMSSSGGAPKVTRTSTSSHDVAHLGVRVRSVDRNTGEKNELTPWRGLLVERVDSGSPAARAGILPGDVLLRLDEAELSSPDQLMDLMENEFEPNGEARLQLLKVGSDGSYSTEPDKLLVALGSRQVEVTRSDTFPLGSDLGVLRLTGLQVGTIDSELAQEIYGSAEPVTLVAAALVGSPAYMAGLRGGDRVVTCDGRPVTSYRDVSRALLSRIDGGDLPAEWFDAESRRELPDGEGEIPIEVDGPLGPHSASLVPKRNLESRSSFHIPIVFNWKSDVASKRWSFLDFIFQFGANYRSSYRSSASRAPKKTWLFSLFPFGMFEFERTSDSNRYCFFWFIELKDRH